MNAIEILKYYKCSLNPAYFINNYGYALDITKEPAEVGQIPCFDYQEDILKKFKKFKNNIVLKSRQTGLSVITAGFVVWTLLFKADQKVLIVANDRNGAVRFLKLVKQFFQYLPKFLQPTQILKDNETEMVFGIIKDGKLGPGNSVQAVASGPNAGRGESLTLLVLDETAFIENAESIWTAASPTLSATNGKCIMISTPFGTGTLYHKTWVSAEKGTGTFEPTRIHWRQHPKYGVGATRKKDEYGREFWTSAWYEQQCEELGNDPVKIAQELDLSFEGSRSLAIDSGIIDKYKKAMEGNDTPICYFDYLQEKNEDCFTNIKTDFWIWKKPELNANYIISSDVALGNGGDYSTIQILNADTLEQVGEFCSKKVSPDILAHIIFKAANIYNKAYAVIEFNNMGSATAYFLKNHFKYDALRIYHSQAVKKLINHHYGYDINEDDEIPGFQTSVKTRPMVIATLGKYMREAKLILHSKRLISEFDTFIVSANGKIEHMPGSHDDLIFGLAIGLFIRDTKYNEVFFSKESIAAMINSIGHSAKNSDEILDLNQKKTNSSFPQAKDTNDNDLSWLYGSIPSK